MTDIARIDIVHVGGDTSIVGGGVLDFTNFEKFHEGLRDASLTSDSVTVDLRSADFIDTAVVQDLFHAAMTLMKREHRLIVIVKELSHPWEALHITGLGTVMNIEIEKSDG